MGTGFFSENGTQGLTSKRGSFCPVDCSYINYLTEVLGIDLN